MSRSYFEIRDRWTTRAGEWLLYALVRSFRWATWPVPTWTLAGLCAPLGGLIAISVPSFRRRAERNLALVWPDRSPAARRHIVHAAGGQFFRLGIEYARLERLARELPLNVEGGEHVAAARAAGRGAVLVTAHYGNWEAGRLAAQRLGAQQPLSRPFRP
jgi:KDO2-lipid IV(A) lauroyltransferase